MNIYETERKSILIHEQCCTTKPSNKIGNGGIALTLLLLELSCISSDNNILTAIIYIHSCNIQTFICERVKKQYNLTLLIPSEDESVLSVYT